MLKPLADRVVVRPMLRQQSTVIFVPDIDQKKPVEGEVVAVGVGRYESGKLIPVSVKVGDIVFYTRYGGSEVEYKREKLMILRESDVLAVTDEEM